MAESPINLIRTMKQQGMSNNDIIQNLIRQGYSNTQIFDAINHIETKNAVESMPENLMQMPQKTRGAENSEFMPDSQDVVTSLVPDKFDPKVEELIETIIDEKWEELIKDVNKIIEWKARAEVRIAAVELKTDSLKQSFDELHRAVIGKISEYDQHILDVGTEIKAMEKVFSKVLPTFTENVHELSRITDKVRQDKL
ncbi:MAG: hypothetical protein V1859_05785 [archaeon]